VITADLYRFYQLKIDKKSGVVMNVAVLKNLVQEMILNPLHHHNIVHSMHFIQDYPVDADW
jgi:NRPS condensation-like uncharacterized protein